MSEPATINLDRLKNRHRAATLPVSLTWQDVLTHIDARQRPSGSMNRKMCRHCAWVCRPAVPVYMVSTSPHGLW